MFSVGGQYILRDILQFDGSLDEAVNRLSNAHRTCDLILGVGDGKVCAALCSTFLFLLFFLSLFLLLS